MKSIKMTLLVLNIGLFLSSCGQSKTTQSPLADGSMEASGVTAKCSVDLNRNSELGMKLQQLEDGNLSLRPDLIRIKLIRFPSGFAIHNQNPLQFWSRTVTSAGTWSTWSKPRFYFEYRDAQGIIRRTNQSYESVSWSDLKQVGLAVGQNIQSPIDFFSRFNLVVQILNPSQRQTLTLALYQNNSQITHEVTALVPGFEINPQAFASTHSSLLSYWHPLQHLANATPEQLVAESKNFCF